MTHLRWTDRSHVEQPIVLAAFEGWNDAGEAATEAVRLLQDQLASRPIVGIDPEEFFDFTSARPHIVRGDDGVRRVLWPNNVFELATPEGCPPLLLLRGVEPQLRWRTFAEAVLEVAETFNARLVVTLGSLLAEVPHTRPCNVFGSAANDTVASALGYAPSNYEGPTGITGVIHELCSDRGINSASIWATVPSYVPAAPSPKAALALLVELGRILDVEVALTDLADEIAHYDAELNEIIAEDEETATYVSHLEERWDREQLAGRSAEALVDEVEAFLREQ